MNVFVLQNMHYFWNSHLSERNNSQCRVNIIKQFDWRYVALLIVDAVIEADVASGMHGKCHKFVV